METVPRYDTDRFTGLDRWHAMRCAAHVEFLDEVVTKNEAQDWEFDGASCMANWLINRYQVSRSTATDWVRVAHAIQELPALRAAYAAGRMSWDQLRSVTRIATPGTDEELAAEAPFLSTRDLNKRAR